MEYFDIGVFLMRVGFSIMLGACLAVGAGVGSMWLLRRLAKKLFPAENGE